MFVPIKMCKENQKLNFMKIQENIKSVFKLLSIFANRPTEQNFQIFFCNAKYIFLLLGF